MHTTVESLTQAPRMQTGRYVLAVLAFVLIAIAQRNVHSQSPSYTPEDLRKHFQNMAQAYDMRSGRTQLKLREQPLMHWQNTVRKQERGALYVWEKNGRPQVLCSIFTFEHEGEVQCRHEMISIADTPLTSQLDSVTVWTPSQAGVNWNRCEGVSAPAESAARRLIQMRAIARQFSGRLNIPDHQPANLQLIPQPLIRYQAPEQSVIDGAVFSMAVGTDPEILLVFEARSSADGASAWHYAAARSHFHELQLKREDQVVWTAPIVSELENTRAGQLPWASQPYFIFFPPKPLPAPEELR